VQTSYTLPIVWIVFALLLIIGGIALTWVGLRGRRVDDHPICRKCGFDLIGLPQGVSRCSECGADLARPRATRYGRRRRRPVILGFGVTALLLMLGLAGVVAWATLRSVDEYRMMPTWYLLRQARYEGVSPPVAAWRELLGRLRADQLSPEQVVRATELALAIQSDRIKRWDIVFGDFIEAARDKTLATDAQWQRYARQAPTISVTLRSKVRRSENLPARINAGGARVGSNSRLSLHLYNADGEGDLIKVHNPRRSGGYAGFGLHSTGNSSTSRTIGLDQEKVATAPLGPREVILRSRLVVREGWDEEKPVLAEWEEEYKATWELVEADAGTVELIDDESYRAAVEKGTTIKFLGSRPQSRDGDMDLEMNFKSIPVPLAHEVLLRRPSDGHEWKLTMITLAGGDMGYSTGGQLEDFDADKVDVLFRPSPAAARDTVHVTQLWNHEFVVKGVAVQTPSTTKPATGASKR
jgi:hypothetical protein